MCIFQFWLPQGICQEWDCCIIWWFYFQFFKKSPYRLPQWLYQLTFPPTVQEYSLFSTPSPAFIVCRHFDDGHSDQSEKAMAPHSSPLAQKIPWTEGPWQAVVHGVARSRTRLSNFTFTFHFHTLEKEMATHSSVLAWRIPGMAEPGGLPSMGLHRVGHD